MSPTFPQGYPRTSPGFANWHIEGPLSNAKITKYAKMGFYGSHRQKLALEQDAIKREKLHMQHKIEQQTKNLLKELLA